MKNRILILMLLALPVLGYAQESQVCVDDMSYSAWNGNEAAVFGLCGTQYSDTIVIHDTVMMGGVPHRVTMLREEAIARLSRLRVLILPESLDTMQSNAIYSCSKLEYVYCNAVTPPGAPDDAIRSLPAQTVLYVPSSSIQKYSEAPAWRNFANNILPIPRKAEVGDTLVARTMAPSVQVRLYYQVLDTVAGQRRVRLIAPVGGYDSNVMTGRLMLPDSVSDGVGDRYAVTEVQGYVLRGCTLLTQPVFLSDTVLVYSGLGRVTDTVPTQVTSIAVGAYIDGIQTASLECLQQYPPRCETGSLDGLDMKIPIFVSKSALKSYLGAAEWRTRNLTPHLSVGDTITVENHDPDYSLYFEITNNQPGKREVLLVGGEDLMGNIVLKDSISAPGGNTYAVVDMADSIFMNNIHIRSLSIGRNMRHVGHHAFGHATMMQSITVDRYNPYFHSVPESNALIETATGRLVLGCKASLVTDGVTAIGQGAFCGQTGLEEINLPASIRTIESRAYDGCSGVRAVRLMCDVPDLGDDTTFLAICLRCGVEVLPQYMEHYQQAWPGVQVSALAIPGALGDTLRYPIAGQAAQFCFRITDNAVYHAEVMLVRAPNGEALPIDTVVLPDTMTIGGARYYLTAISDSIWSGATDLKHVTISASVEQIATMAFAGLQLRSIAVDPKNAYYDSRNQCNAIVETATNRLVKGCENTILDNSLRIIGAYALANVGWKEITLPVGIRAVEAGALANNPFQKIICRGAIPCEMDSTSLDGINRGISVHVPTGTENAYRATKVWDEFDVYFEYTPDLEVGDVFECITDEYRLFYCRVIDTNGYQKEVAIIPPEEFRYHFRGTLVVPDTVRDMYGQPYVVTMLEQNAFLESPIDSLVLPAHLTTIAAAALRNCSYLQAIRCEALVPPVVVSSTVFEQVSTEIPVYVYSESLSQYKIVAGWQRFYNILPIVDPIPEGVDPLESPLKGEAVKCIVNGQMVIVRGEQKYDVVGRRIQ